MMNGQEHDPFYVGIVVPFGSVPVCTAIAVSQLDPQHKPIHENLRATRDRQPILLILSLLKFGQSLAPAPGV